MGISDVKELTAGIVISGVKIEHPTGKIIIVCWGVDISNICIMRASIFYSTAFYYGQKVVAGAKLGSWVAGDIINWNRAMCFDIMVAIEM